MSKSIKRLLGRGRGWARTTGVSKSWDNRGTNCYRSESRGKRREGQPATHQLGTSSTEGRTREKGVGNLVAAKPRKGRPGWEGFGTKRAG